MNEIKVMLVEDDIDWLKAMKNFLEKEKDISIVATASTKEVAVALARETEIDIILMDVNLSENKCDGIYAAKEISEFNKAKIIMLTSFDEEEIIVSSFTAGAVSFVSKLNYKSIPDSIRFVIYNSLPIEILLKDYKKLKEEDYLKELTYAEKEIFKLIADGLTHTEICQKLGKSHNTLKNQIKSILRKLEVKSCKEAVQKVSMKEIN